MKKLFLLVALVAFSFAFSQETIRLNKFKNLVIASDSEVTIIKSNKNELVINDAEDTNVVNESGTLVLGSDGDFMLYYSGDIENITIASDAVLKSEDEIKVNKLSITADSDAEVTLKIKVKELETTASSDAVITLSGKAKNHAAFFSSDAELHAKNLIVENTDIVLSSDAEAVIYTKNTVNAQASSDAEITIYGNPKKVNKTIGSDAEIIIVN